MSVEIDPPEQLEFNRPFTQQVARSLHVRNVSDVPIAYKVKTTAPRSYCVRPNSGRIEPGQEIDVQVLLQAMKVDIPMDLKCKDKFLIQTTTIPDSSSDVGLTDLWAQIEKDVSEGLVSRDIIQQKKIRCVWGPPLDSTNDATEDQPGDFGDTQVKENGVTEPVPQEGSHVQPPPVVGGNAQFSTPSSIILPPLVPTTPPTDNSPPTSTAPTVSSLEARLKEANAQIAALKKKLEIGGSDLRQRNTATSSNLDSTTGPRPSSAREVMQTAVEQGVPVKIVAYLCLAAFLIAYLFF